MRFNKLQNDFKKFMKQKNAEDEAFRKSARDKNKEKGKE